MAVYEINRCGQRVITHGTQGQCWCGKPAETEIQIGWVPEANAGAGGGQYDEVCFGCWEEENRCECDSHNLASDSV